MAEAKFFDTTGRSYGKMPFKLINQGLDYMVTIFDSKFSLQSLILRGKVFVTVKKAANSGFLTVGISGSDSASKLKKGTIAILKERGKDNYLFAVIE